MTRSNITDDISSESYIADQKAYNAYINDETDFEIKSVDCDGCHHTFTRSQLTDGLMGHSLCDDCHQVNPAIQ